MKPDAIDLITARLILSRASIPQLTALIAGADEYQRAFGHKVAEGYIESPGALEFFLQQAQAAAADGSWWLPYLIIHRADEAVIGGCGCKGPPDDHGVVEIGYSIAPAYRGHGFGHEAASALVVAALALPRITAVRAHTLPEISASTRILAKCGFIQVGEIIDPEDGPVWRWQLTEFQAP